MVTEVKYDVGRATEAVQFLVNDPYAVNRYKTLRKAITQPRRLPYKDDAEVLNELIVIGRQSPIALEKLIAIVEFKRNLSEKTYMASFMAASRKRVKDALRVQEIMAGVAYNAEERYEAERKVKELWTAEKMSFIEEAERKYVEATGEEALPYDQRIEVNKAFWAKIDAELVDMKERAEALSVTIKAPKKYKVVVDKKVLDSEIARKLNEAYAVAEKTKRGK